MSLHESQRTIIVLGIGFAFITLIGDSFQTIINNSRPPEIDALMFAWITSCIELVILFPFFIKNRLKKQKLSQYQSNLQDNIPKFTNKSIFSLGISGIIFAFCAYYLIVGFSLVDSVTGILAIKTQPISMMIIGSIMLKERLSIKEVLIGLLMFLLMVYIGTAGTFSIENLSIGVIYLLIVPIFWNIGHSIAKPFIQKQMLTVNEFVFIRIGITVVILTILFAFIGNWAELEILSTPQALISIFSMGLLFAVLHNTWYQTIKRLQVSIASFIVLPSPVLTALFVFLITHEPLYSYHIIGISGELLAIFGLILIQKNKK